MDWFDFTVTFLTFFFSYSPCTNCVYWMLFSRFMFAVYMIVIVRFYCPNEDWCVIWALYLIHAWIIVVCQSNCLTIHKRTSSFEFPFLGMTSNIFYSRSSRYLSMKQVRRWLAGDRTRTIENLRINRTMNSIT